MQIVPIAKIIRAKNCHLTDLQHLKTLDQVEKWLLQKGFKMIEATSDGFMSTYEHPDYKDENKNTLVHINFQEVVMDVIFGTVKPEGMPFK